MSYDPSGTGARLRITRRRAGAVLRLGLAGELDLSTVGQLREAAAAALVEPELGTLLLDLAELAFLDSVGMGAMAAAYQHAITAGIEFMVVNATGAPLRALRMTALDRVFVHPDPAADGSGAQAPGVTTDG